MILLHVLIALSSMAFTTFLYFSPSKNKLRASYVLVALTLTSGTYLVVSTGTPILRACLTGLIYLGAVSLGIVLAERKLAIRQLPNDHNRVH